jgi:hypothetical protein
LPAGLSVEKPDFLQVLHQNSSGVTGKPREKSEGHEFILGQLGDGQGLPLDALDQEY